MQESQAVLALSALAQPTRLAMIRHLVSVGSDGESAGAVGEAAGVSASNASFHLATLEQAGLIASRRVSRSIVYCADFSALGQLVDYLLSDCCGGAPEVLACCQSATASSD